MVEQTVRNSACHTATVTISLRKAMESATGIQPGTCGLRISATPSDKSLLRCRLMTHLRTQGLSSSSQHTHPRNPSWQGSLMGPICVLHSTHTCRRLPGRPDRRHLWESSAYALRLRCATWSGVQRSQGGRYTKSSTAECRSLRHYWL